MSTKSEWATVVVGGVQFAAGIAVAWWTFSKQHADSIGQRESEWFHRVVVDKTITTLHELVERESLLLEESARRCVNALSGVQAGTASYPAETIDEIFRTELQAFRSRVAPARQKLTHYAFIFDANLHNEVSSAFRDLEDNVSEWFDRLQIESRVTPRPSLIEIVCGAERQLLDAFRRFEFIELPKLHARTLAGGRAGRPKWPLSIR